MLRTAFLLSSLLFAAACASSPPPDPPATPASATDAASSRTPHAPAAPAAHHDHSTAPARATVHTVPKGRNPGTPQHEGEFQRAGPGCNCASDPLMGECKCLHCSGEPGSLCYCGQGKPRCLCGIDMAQCRCVHCCGREGKGCDVCPCDHDETRKKLGLSPKDQGPSGDK